MLAHGTEVVGRPGSQEPVAASLDEFKDLLRRAAARNLPLVVANPDVVTVSGDSLVPMPGTFARWYTQMNGQVRAAHFAVLLFIFRFEFENAMMVLPSNMNPKQPSPILVMAFVLL